MLEVMLRNGNVNVNQTEKYGINAFWIAAFYGQKDAVRMLNNTLIDKFSANSKGSNALHIAVKRNHLTTVQAIIETGYPLDNTKDNGLTALAIAAYNNNLEII